MTQSFARINIMRHFRAIGAASLVGSLVSIVGGCGGPGAASTPEPAPEQRALQEVGEMYRVYSDQHKVAPRGEADIATYSPAFSSGSMALVNRQVTVYWGSKLVPGSEAVLANEKDVAKAGGLVLLQDGETVKKMAADEFRDAPKAGRK
jgi:hypothetical protein